MIDLAGVRAETPGCLDRVFLDSAGSSLPPTRVLDTVVAHLRREVEVGGYQAAEERAADLAEVPARLGALLGAPADSPADSPAGSVALMDSATRAWSQFVTALPWQPGDRVLITGVEYASNAIALLQQVRAAGISVEEVPSDSTGRVDLAALEGMLDERVRLVSLVHVPTNSGLVNPVREVVDAAHRVGALVLLDACQSVGQLEVDVAALGVDALTGTGRKWLRAPRGTGFLYVDPRLLDDLEPAAADLRGAEWTGPDSYSVLPGARRFELWEADVAGRLGLGEAVGLCLDLGIAAVARAVTDNAAVLRAGLAQVPGVRVRDEGAPLCGIVSFTVDGVEATEVRDRLGELGVRVSVSWASSTRLDMARRGLESVVRASPHYFVSGDQLDQAVWSVASLAEGGSSRRGQ